MLFGKIKNFSYQKEWKTELDFFDIEQTTVNDLPSKSLVTVHNKRWLSANGSVQKEPDPILMREFMILMIASMRVKQ